MINLDWINRGVRSAAAVAAVLAALGGCTTSATTTSRSSTAYGDIHLCAVGFDLARSFAKKVQVRGTELKVPRKQSRCEEFTIDYLRRAGYAIEETGSRSDFSVELFPEDENTLVGVARFGNNIMISRHYKRAETGVYGLTPPNVIVTDGGTS